MANPFNPAPNNDENEWHTVKVRHFQLKLPVRYQDPTYIACGGFGIVISADDTVTGQRVAIKQLLQPFKDKFYAQRTYREANLLIRLNHPDSSTIQLHNIFTPDPNLDDFQSLYFVFDYIPYNLHQVIRRGIHFQEDHIQHIIYSILRGLKYMHSAGVIHRDIKPVNIGIDDQSNVTILDLGLSRTFQDATETMTGYVITRWWRAPEISLTWQHYDAKVDVWSVGCIMGEMIRLEPIFQGENTLDQLRVIMSSVGTPTEEELLAICSQNVADQVLQLGNFPPGDFNALFGYRHDPNTNEILSGVGEQGIQFLRRLLTINPHHRPTVEEALNDPFMASLHDSTEEPVIDSLADEYGNGNDHTVNQWKELTWNLVRNFVRPDFLN